MKNNVYQIDKNKKVIVYFLTYDNREFKGVARCNSSDTFDEEKGKKIAQLIPKCIPKISNVEVLKPEEDFEQTDRGSAGFGSTGIAH